MSHVVVVRAHGFRSRSCRNPIFAAAALGLFAAACSGHIDSANESLDAGSDSGEEQSGSVAGGSADGGGAGGADDSGGAPPRGTTDGDGGADDAGEEDAGSPAGAGSDGGIPMCQPVRATGSGSGGSAGQWTRVSVPISYGDCGAQTLMVDPVRPSDFYALVCVSDRSAATLKSTDYGQTFKRVDRSGFDGNPTAGAIDPNPCRDPSAPPTFYSTALYGELGLWKSTDGGVNWKQLMSGAKGSVPGLGCSNYWPPDFYNITILPDDPPNHILVTYHAGGWSCSGNGFVESFDGGKTFIEHRGPSGFGASQYVVLADPQTWILSDEDKVWRTTSAGRLNGQPSPNAWKEVNVTGHTHGAFTAWITGDAIYLPSFSGIYRSTDKGANWTHVYGDPADAVVGTDKYLYLNASSPSLKRASVASGTDWANYTTLPSSMTVGPSPKGGVSSFDGKSWVLVTSNDDSGIWRYVEP